MSASQDNQYHYRDPALPVEERVKDLISHMTLEEKTTQLLHTSKAIPRLGIPEYDWWNECLHGVARAGRATVFPQAIGMAATFDKDLILKIATAISDEARAKYNAAQKIGNRERFRGINFWSPNINIFRDPRWGRGQETYGEDPYLTAVLGSAFVKGLQGNDPKYLKTAACAKHYAVHSGPEKLRHEFNAKISLKDLHETYLPAFKALVEAGVEIIMGAYNRLNGEPCCAHTMLLEKILRKKWGFNGHVVSDCWAIQDFYINHKVTSTPEESVALALKKGCDLNCGCIFGSKYLQLAIKKGLITEKEIDAALKNVLKTRFRLGMFDPPEMVPYSSLGDDVVNCQKHRDLAFETAVKSIVLLKNKNNLLPLSIDLKDIYVFGENAIDVELLHGNYHGFSIRMVTILEGIFAKIGTGTTVWYKRSIQQILASEAGVEQFKALKKADVFIAAMGITAKSEGEENDRKDINLPGNQVQLIKELSKLGVPIVVVLSAGSPLVITEIVDLVDAIIYIWYPGEEGGNAVGDILFGNISPSGKLPVTFPASIGQLPDYTDYSMNNRTYRYIKDEPLFPFGFGLHYTTFSYTSLELSSSEIQREETVTAHVTVTNTGNYESDEVVQLYLDYKEASVKTPVYTLKAFRRIHLNPGESTKESFTLTPDMMRIINNVGEAILETGTINVIIGGSSPGERSKTLGAPEEVSGEFQIV